MGACCSVSNTADTKVQSTVEHPEKAGGGGAVAKPAPEIAVTAGSAANVRANAPSDPVPKPAAPAAAAVPPAAPGGGAPLPGSVPPPSQSEASMSHVTPAAGGDISPEHSAAADSGGAVPIAKPPLAGGAMAKPPAVASKVAPYRRVQDLAELYELGAYIASGGYSDVYRCVHKESGQGRAIKVMQKEKLTGKRRIHVMREVEILRRCSHPNILSLYEVVDTPTQMCLVMELIVGGDLYDYIVNHHRYLTEGQAVKIIRCILEAVDYLHAASPPVIHRDIKPENVLIEDVDKERVKLSDFGLSKILMDPKSVECTPGGTSLYLPPEIIEGIKKHGAQPRPTNVRDMKSLDLWSTGIVLYILLCGSPPFRGGIQNSTERQKLLEQIKQGVPFPEHRWHGVSAEARELVTCLLQIDPSKRYTARQALSHRWIQQTGTSKTFQLCTGTVMSSEYRNKQEFNDVVAGACKGVDLEKPAPPGENAPAVPAKQIQLAGLGQSNLMAKRKKQAAGGAAGAGGKDETDSQGSDNSPRQAVGSATASAPPPVPEGGAATATTEAKPAEGAEAEKKPEAPASEPAPAPPVAEAPKEAAPAPVAAPAPAPAVEAPKEEAPKQ